MLADVLLVGLAAFAVTQVIRDVLPWPLQRPTKLVIAWAVAVGFAIVLATDPWEAAVMTWAGMGVALICHKVYRHLSAAGDAHQVGVMMASRRRP